MNAGLDYVKKGSFERQVLVVVSDGGDNASAITRAQVLANAQASNAVIYTIALVDPMDDEADPGFLSHLSEMTGGVAFRPKNIGEVEEIFQRVARDIRNMYTLGYVPSSTESAAPRSVRKRRTSSCRSRRAAARPDRSLRFALAARISRAPTKFKAMRADSDRTRRVAEFAASWRSGSPVSSSTVSLRKAWRYQQEAKADVEQMMTVERPPEVTGKLPNVEKPLVPGELIGRVDIPRLKLSAAVAEGDDDKTLGKAVGHLPDTPLPWHQRGNVGLAAHRDGLFRRLEKIRLNDEVRVVTSRGEYHYRVTKTHIVDPDDVWVLAPTATPTITLITCYPFSFVGNAPQRFIVQAELVGEVAGSVLTGSVVPCLKKVSKVKRKVESK